MEEKLIEMMKKRQKNKNKFLNNLIFHLFIFIIAVILIIIFYSNNLILTLLIIFLSFIALKIYFRKSDIYFYVIAAILGPIGEILAIRYGVWRYTNPTFLGIPLWLPFAWGAVVVLIRNVSLNFIKETKIK